MEEESESETTKPIGEELSNSIGLRRIDLALDHPQEVYYGGHEISGKVFLDLDEPVNAIGIRIKCKGEAQVYFTDRSAGLRRKFSADESYLHEEIYIVGGGNGKSMIMGGAYPFSLTLPKDLPCSFEGRYGRVRYSIRALLDITTVYRFSTNIIPFTVAPILDLNRDPLAPLPVSEKQTKIFMGHHESMTMSMSLPVRGYVPGQTIPIRINIENPSKVFVRKLRIAFKKVVTYHATEKSRKHKEIVVEVDQPIGEDDSSCDVAFDVPAVPPTGMLYCNIIDVLYTLKVESQINVSEWYYRIFHKNLKLRTSIVIGTIPLSDYQIPRVDQSAETVGSLSTSTMNTGRFNESSITNDYRDDETEHPNPSMPTYEKSQIYRSSKPDRDDPTGDDGDSDGEVKPYSPMYRVYKFENYQTK